MKLDFKYLNRDIKQNAKCLIFSNFGDFEKIVIFSIKTMPDTKLHVTEMWKKTIIDEKIKTNPVVKSDLHCDLSK